MTKQVSGLIVGLVLVVAGGLLWWRFADVETPAVGLRQVGVVLVVLGLIDAGVSAVRIRAAARRR